MDKNENALKFTFKELQEKLGPEPEVNMISCYIGEVDGDPDTFIIGHALTTRNVEDDEKIPINLLHIDIHGHTFDNMLVAQTLIKVTEEDWELFRQSPQSFEDACAELDCMNGPFDISRMIRSKYILNDVEDWEDEWNDWKEIKY